MKSFYSAFIAENGRLHFFGCDRGLLYEEIKGNTFEKNDVSLNSSGRFSVCVLKEMLIFSVGSDGSMDFFRKKGSVWKKQTLIRKGFPWGVDFRVFSLGESMVMMFRNKDEIMVSKFTDGIWEKPAIICKGDFFSICGGGKDFFTAALWEKNGGIQLKEIYINKGISVKESMPFIKNAGRIKDISFLMHEGKVFACYLVKNMFSMQIWFKEKGDDKKEIFVWEGIYADKVLVSVKDGVIYVLWTMGNIYMFSEYDKERHVFHEARSGKADFGGKAEKAYFMDITGDFDFKSEEMLYGRSGIPDIFIKAEEETKENIKEDNPNGQSNQYKTENMFSIETDKAELERLLEERNEELYSLRGAMQAKVRTLNKRIEELEEEIKNLKEKEKMDFQIEINEN